MATSKTIWFLTKSKPLSILKSSKYGSPEMPEISLWMLEGNSLHADDYRSYVHLGSFVALISHQAWCSTWQQVDYGINFLSTFFCSHFSHSWNLITFQTLVKRILFIRAPVINLCGVFPEWTMNELWKVPGRGVLESFWEKCAHNMNILISRLFLVESSNSKKLNDWVVMWQIAGGWRHTVALDEQGQLYGWGWNKVLTSCPL